MESIKQGSKHPVSATQELVPFLDVCVLCSPNAQKARRGHWNLETEVADSPRGCRKSSLGPLKSSLCSVAEPSTHPTQ